MDEPFSKRTPETTLEEAHDDLDDAAHRHQDELVLVELEPLVESRQFNLLLLLSTIIRFSEGKLDPKFREFSEAVKLLREHPGLMEKLKDAWKTRTFRDIRNLKILHPPMSEPPDPWSTFIFQESSSLTCRLPRSILQESSDDLKCFKQAFEMKYTAQFPDILLTTMDLYVPQKGPKYFNRSFSIVQSSGMGKSRLVDHSARARLTFPFNLHEKLPFGSKTYPPFDNNVRDYLTYSFGAEEPALIRHFAFLSALFTQAVEVLKTYQNETQADVALKWYNWMAHGSTLTSVGTHRTAFYDHVIQVAQNIEKGKLAALGIDSAASKPLHFLSALRHYLKKAATDFVSCLKGLHGDINDQFLAIVYFDEAHTLQIAADSRLSRGYNPYSALMHVLSSLENIPIFFIFLSTNTSLFAFEPTDAEFPLPRVQAELKLIPPFFEVPFDVFCHDFTAQVLTLNEVCKPEQMMKFGRPMWFSHHSSISGYMFGIHPTISLAMMKLGSNNFAADPLAQLAALDCRILIQFDPISPESLKMQAQLIKSRMRVIFNIHCDREFVQSGYPSEPILAEAAARLLNERLLNDRLLNERLLNECLLNEPTNNSIMQRAPDILQSALKNGFLACGERGELVARALFTVAHDRAIQANTQAKAGMPHFHQPIKLLRLLECLVAPDIWNIIQSASPFHAYPGDRTLKEAFDDVWVNFSHFVQLGDYDSFNLRFASELLKRGVAIQAHDRQYDMDGGLPLHCGDPNKAVAQENTSILQYKVKTTETACEVGADPNLVGPGNKHPVITIIMQLGVEKGDGKRVALTTISKGRQAPAGRTRSSVMVDPANIHRRHYIIQLFGCTSKTYSCIPEDSQVYRDIFKPQSPFLGFPRIHVEENLLSLYALKPVMFR